MREHEAYQPAKTSVTSPDDRTFEVMYRPTTIDKAHQKAREYEEILTEAASFLSPYDFSVFEADTLNDLNESCHHIDERVLVTGIVQFTGIDITKGIDEAGEAAEVNVRVQTTDVTARSLGYTSLRITSDQGHRIAIMHKAHMDPAPTMQTETATIYQSGHLTIPVDGSADVQLEHEPMPPHLDLLQTYIPDIVEDIDVALFNTDDLTKQLRNLSRIHFTDNDILTGKGGAELKQEIANYINSQLDLELLGLCYVAGTKDVIVPTDTSYIQARLEKFRTAGIPQRVQFSPIDNQLVLVMDVPFHKRGLQAIMYILNSRITVTTGPQLLM